MKYSVKMTWMSAAALVCAASMAGAQVAPAAEKTRTVSLLEIEGRPGERPSEFAWLGGGKHEATLRDFVQALLTAAEDPNLSGVVIRLKDSELGLTQVEELGSAITTLRKAGKKVHVFAEAYGQTDLLLGSYADEIIGQTGSPVSFPGMYSEEMFLADTLKWVGVTPNFVQVGDYKGASEMMGRSAPSPQWTENLNQLLDSLYGNMRSTMKSGRKLDDAKLDNAMQVAWMAHADDAQTVGLVDTIIDLPDLTAALSKSSGGEVTWGDKIEPGEQGPKMDMSNPFAIFSMLSKKPNNDPKGPTIAVLHIDGAIVDGDSTGGGIFGGGGSVGSRTMRRAMDEIEEKDLIKGVIVRIDSPGGSATASEVIWQGIKRLSKKKPVWVSVGSMAASGGYYCAVAGDKIYVNPSSIVGSIGVVGGRLAMDDLYKMAKVNVVPHTRGPMAGIFRSTTPWTPEEVEAVRVKMKQTYDLFTSRVTAGRKGIELSKTAEGRLFTGDKAIGLKMADKVGGLEVALADFASELKLEEYDVMDFPGPKSLDDLIKQVMGSVPGASAPGVSSGILSGEIASMGRKVFGEAAWDQISTNMNGLMELRKEPVILMSPSVLVFK